MGVSPNQYQADLEICTRTNSKRKSRNAVYQFIGEVASPGDIMFVTSPKEKPQTNFGRLKWCVNFTSQGYPKDDYREWGTLVFSHMEKESKGGNWVPIVYQSKEPELAKFQIPPGYFRGNSRLEILNFFGVGQSSSQKILSYLDERVGQPHDHTELTRNRITFQTGLPNFHIRHDLVNCVRTTMEAYASAGHLFSHRCEYASLWNYARYVGYPMFHSPEGVCPYYNYLQDHHLYTDVQMKLVGAVSQIGDSYIASTASKKFSWVTPNARAADGAAQANSRVNWNVT